MPPRKKHTGTLPGTQRYAASGDNERTTIERERDEKGRPLTRHGRALSTKPANIRARLRRQQVKSVRDVELLYGKPLEEWDLEELARGRPRDKSGKWHGTGSRLGWATSPIMREAQERVIQMTVEKITGLVPAALQVIAKLLTNEDVDFDGKPLVDGKTKLAAAQFLIEHVIGKPKQRVDITGDEAVKQVMAAALVMPNLEPAHPINNVIEGHVVDHEEGDFDDD